MSFDRLKGFTVDFTKELIQISQDGSPLGKGQPVAPPRAPRLFQNLLVVLAPPRKVRKPKMRRNEIAKMLSSLFAISILSDSFKLN